jgi:RHS repeat-associated protein
LIDPRGNKVRYQYNGQGDLVSVTDRDGNVIVRYGYRADADNPHYLETVTGALGQKTLSAGYDTSGRVDQLTDAAGSEATRGYNLDTLTQSFTDPALPPGQQTTSVTFDPRGNQVKAVDNLGQETDVTYEHDLPVTVTRVVGQPGGGDDVTIRFTYDSRGNVLTKSNELGNVSRLTYNDFGEPLTVSDPLGNTLTNHYDDKGNLTRIARPDEVESDYEYDSHGNALVVRQGAAVSQMAYTAEGYLSSATDPASLTPTFSYDANGNPAGTSTTWVNPDDPNDVQVLTTAQVYDGNDAPTRGRDEQGNFTTTEYDLAGRPWRTTDTFGTSREETFDVRGMVIQRRVQSTDVTGNVVWLLQRTVYDAQGRPVVETEPYLDGATDVRGRRTTYDALGRVVRTDRLKGVVIDLVGTAPNLSAVLNTAGTVISGESTQYDSLGRVSVHTDQYDLETHYTYTPTGQLLQVRTQARDENNVLVWLVQRTVYDSYGRTVVATDPYLEGATTPVMGTRTVYDLLGRTIRTERLQGVVIDLDSGNTVLTSAGTVLWTEQTIYNDKGQVQRTVALDGQITDYEYDELGRQTAQVGSPVPDPYTGVVVRLRTEVEYDPYSQVRLRRTNIRQFQDGTTDASAARETTYAYDAFGQTVKTTFADGTTLKLGYNSFGQETSEDQAGLVRNFEYTKDRLTAVVLPAVPDPLNGNALTRPRYDYTYDEFGNQRRLHDPRERDTTFTSTTDGRPLTRTLPEGETEEYRYDELDRQKLHISFEGVVTESVYDDLGRLAQKRFFPNVAAYAGGAGTPAETISYTYDAFGRVVREISSTRGETDTAYDPDGRVTRVASPEGVLNYRYDNLGRLVRTFTGSEAAPVNDTRYDYDALSRLHIVTVWERNGVLLPEANREVTRYQYDLVGNLDEVFLPNGVITKYEYDPLNRLNRLTQYAPDATPNDLSDNPKLAEYDYHLRPDGQRDHVTETRWENSIPQLTNIDWTYDDAGRLTEEVFANYDGALDYTAHYTYDLVGNRLQKTVDQGRDGVIDQVFTYTYDRNDRLLTETLDRNNDGTVDQTTTYGYIGTEQTSKDVTEGGVPQSRTTYDYDLQGRLAVVTVESYQGGVLSRRERATFGYDDNGARVDALYEVDANGDGTFETRTNTEFLNDPANPTDYSQVLQETVTDAGTGQVQRKVVYTLGLDVISQTTTEYSSGQPGTPTTLVFGYDGHGSTRVLLDMAAAVATVAGVRQVFDYDAFGNLLNMAAAQAATSLLYSGEMFDARIAQQYLRARWYDPAVGRFNQLDPFFGNLQNPQSLHKYLYTHGDPVNFADPSGMIDGGMLSSLVSMTIQFGQQALNLTAQMFARAYAGGKAGAAGGFLFGFIDGLLDTGDWVTALGTGAMASIMGGFVGFFLGGAGALAKALGLCMEFNVFVAAFGIDQSIQGIKEALDKQNLPLAIYRGLGGLLTAYASIKALGACFAAGTPILTPDGHKPIEALQVGDRVLSRPDDDPFQPLRPKQVIATFDREDRILEVHVAGQLLRTTPEHPLYVKGRGWTKARDLQQGSMLISHDNRWMHVEMVVFTNEVEKVYNITVEDDNTYYVGQEDWPAAVWAHNAQSCQWGVQVGKQSAKMKATGSNAAEAAVLKERATPEGVLPGMEDAALSGNPHVGGGYTGEGKAGVAGYGKAIGDDGTLNRFNKLAGETTFAWLLEKIDAISQLKTWFTVEPHAESKTIVRLLLNTVKAGQDFFSKEGISMFINGSANDGSKGLCAGCFKAIPVLAKIMRKDFTIYWEENGATWMQVFYRD